ncbi:MAG: DUF4097 family beta strand repeat-containing protein [Gemmatimonadaceae bacterium]
MTLHVLAVVLAALTVNPSVPVFRAPAQSVEVFNGPVAQGAWFRVRNLKGAIEVRESTGRNVIVTASRRAGSGDDDDVRFDVRRDGANVTVCAIWPRTTRCDANGYNDEGGYRRRNDGGIERVDFVVELPRGINLVAGTGNGTVEVRNTGAEVNASSGNGEVTVVGASGRVHASSGNGDLEIERAGGAVEASTGNGDITVTTSIGPVSASSGNGRIEVEMASLRSSEDMRFSTGNGSIDVGFPSNLSAVIDARVPYKNFETDFPIEMAAGWGSSSVEGKIGNGGRRIRFSTGNGHVRIRKTS